MTTSHLRRAAATITTSALALAGALVPSSPASASIGGEAVFFASPASSSVVVLAGGRRATVSAFPTAQVLAGHFTSSAGAQAFLYNPGAGPDALLDVTRQGGGLATDLTATPVSGRFQPFVSDLDLDGRDDIFWYAPGTAKDYAWFFEADGSITSLPFRVDAVAQPVPVLVDGINDRPARQAILWYGRGSRPDALWTFTGRSASSRRVSINGAYRIAVGHFFTPNYGTSKQQVLFYDPAGGRGSIWTFHRGDGNHRSDPTLSPGRGYVPFVTRAGLHGNDFVWWYGPGPNPEQAWSFQSASKVFTGAGPTVSSTSRVLRDPQGRSADEEIVFLGEGTTARTLQLAPEHDPVLGTVTTIDGLPAAPRAAATWFEQPVA